MNNQLQNFVCFLNKKLSKECITENHVYSIIIEHLRSKDCEQTFRGLLGSNCLYVITKKMRPIFTIEKNALDERYISSLKFIYVEDNDIRDAHVQHLNKILANINYKSLAISSIDSDLSQIKNIKF